MSPLAQMNANETVPDEKGELGEKVLPVEDAFTEDESRRVRRRIDLHVLPLLWALFTLQFMDKQSLNYSAIWGLKKDLNLSSSEYAWTGSIFYFGYLVAQVIFTPLVHRIKIAKYVTIIIFAWSMILMTMPACKNFTGLAINRFFLGMTEGGIAPAFIILTSLFYTRSEQALRAAIWVSGNAFGNIFGGALGYAFGSAHTALGKWMLFPIVFGAISMSFGVLFWYMVPDTLDQARWLSDDEKRIAILRIRSNMTGTKTGTFSWYEVREAFIDPQTYLLGLIMFVNNLQASGPGTFGSQIVKSFGFSALNTTVLQSCPTGGFQAICVILSGYLATRYRNVRLPIMFISNIPAIVGGACLYALPKSNTGLLGAYICVYSGPATQSLAFALVSANVAGYTKKTVVAGVALICYSAAQISGPHFFTEPPYTLGFAMMMACYVVTMVCAVCLYIYYRWENHRRDKAAIISTASKAVADEKDLTDFQRKATFRYSL